jgi:copper chaperone
MATSIINVYGMSCQHCIDAITGALTPLPGVDSVAVDLDAKTVTVDHDPAQSPIETLKDEIEDQGFDVAE